MIQSFWQTLTLPFRRPRLMVFFLWSWTLLWLLEGKRFTLFLLPDLYPLLLASAVLMLIFFWLTLGPQASKSSLHSFLSSAVLLLPLLYFLPVKDETLGIYAYTKRSYTQLQTLERALPTETGMGAPSHLSPKPTLLEITRDWEAYLGKDVEIQGQLAQGGDIPSPYGFLFGFVVSCCAADAQPVGLFVEGAPLKNLPGETAWVRTRGALNLTHLEEHEQLVFQAHEVEIIPAPLPSERYLYEEPLTP